MSVCSTETLAELVGWVEPPPRGKRLDQHLYKDVYLYLRGCQKTGETTALTKATTKSRSLRTTIPMGIVKQFNLSEGDKLNWEIRAQGGELIIVVRPSKRRGEEKDDAG